jgi:hypothetical protein
MSPPMIDLKMNDQLEQLGKYGLPPLIEIAVRLMFQRGQATLPDLFLTLGSDL